MGVACETTYGLLANADQLLFPAFVVFHIDASLLLVVNTPCGVVSNSLRKAKARTA